MEEQTMYQKTAELSQHFAAQLWAVQAKKQEAIRCLGGQKDYLVGLIAFGVINGKRFMWNSADPKRPDDRLELTHVPEESILLFRYKKSGEEESYCLAPDGQSGELEVFVYAEGEEQLHIFSFDFSKPAQRFNLSSTRVNRDREAYRAMTQEFFRCFCMDKKMDKQEWRCES